MENLFVRVQGAANFVLKLYSIRTMIDSKFLSTFFVLENLRFAVHTNAIECRFSKASFFERLKYLFHKLPLSKTFVLILYGGLDF